MKPNIAYQYGSWYCSCGKYIGMGPDITSAYRDWEDIKMRDKNRKKK